LTICSTVIIWGLLEVGGAGLSAAAFMLHRNMDEV